MLHLKKNIDYASQYLINNLYMGLIKSGYDDVVIMPNLTLILSKLMNCL